MQPFLIPMTISGPFGQYTVDAIVDPGATFSSVPTPALIELGIQPHRVIRVDAGDGTPQFRQLGRALTTVGGQEDVLPVMFGEPGEPVIVGQMTLSILLLEANFKTQTLEPTLATITAFKGNRAQTTDST